MDMQFPSKVSCGEGETLHLGAMVSVQVFRVSILVEAVEA